MAWSFLGYRQREEAEACSPRSAGLYTGSPEVVKVGNPEERTGCWGRWEVRMDSRRVVE